MNKTIESVEKWAVERGIDKANPRDQFLKVAEEFGEVGAALARSDHEALMDGIGDCVVTLIILAMQNGTTLQDCLNVAYAEIAERKGKVVNGVFVKESDLQEAEE